MERRGHSLAIEADECRRLLADAGVGRLGWPASEGLVILPVNYRLAGETIVFRVDPASVLAELAEPREVAFEVDDVDPVTATAWSVLVRGTTRRADELDPVAPAAWAGGARSLVIALDPHHHSGRSVSGD